MGRKTKFVKCLITVMGFLLLFQGGFSSDASEKKDEPLAILYSASDFQNLDGHESGAKELKKIIDRVYDDGYSKITEAFLCGDYYYDDEISVEESRKGIETIYDLLHKRWGLEYDEIYFVQGNHDPSDTPNLDSTGGIEKDHYSVYQINHDDFRWNRVRNIDTEEGILESSKKLDSWLKEKVDTRYQKPIFIISHVPLHLSYRYDNPYAEYLFDVINSAAEKGLNIFYLFGHNHAQEYDNYLGSSAIFLGKGEEILIPDSQGETAGDYKQETLNFSYLNAGYIGEARNDELSTCIFEVYEDRVIISRYTEDGPVNMKNPGTSSSHDLGWAANTGTKNSPQVVQNNKLIISASQDLIENNEFVLDIGQSKSIGIKTDSLEEYRVTWSIDRIDIASLVPEKQDQLTATIVGKKYGTAVITAEVTGTEASTSLPVKMEFTVHVVPEGAVQISYNRFSTAYRLIESMVEELQDPDSPNKDYLIINSNHQGAAKAFMTQHDENVATCKSKVLYFPGVGNVVITNTQKNILWRFERIEDSADDVQHYYLKVSPKSPYRFDYYIATTNGVDLTNMRTDASKASDGIAVFQFEQKKSNELLLTKNEHNTLVLGFDESEDQFLLKPYTPEQTIYFYEKIQEPLFDLFVWVDNRSGSAPVNSGPETEVGSFLTVMHGEKIEEIPVTLQMLSGQEINTSGNYTCTLTYNGKDLCEDFELQLTPEESSISKLLTYLKELIARTSPGT